MAEITQYIFSINATQLLIQSPSRGDLNEQAVDFVGTCVFWNTDNDIILYHNGSEVFSAPYKHIINQSPNGFESPQQATAFIQNLIDTGLSNPGSSSTSGLSSPYIPYFNGTVLTDSWLSRDSNGVVLDSGKNYYSSFGHQFVLLSEDRYDNQVLGNSGGAFTSGVDNLYVGWGLGSNTTTGSENTGVGNYSLFSNVSGGQNTAMGNAVLNSNTIGSENTGLGWGALYYSVSGDNNTAIGAQALILLETGANNTAIGQEAGLSNVSGSGNVFLGYNAGYNELGSNKLYIANSNTSTPLILGDFSTSELALNSSLLKFGTSNSKTALTEWYNSTNTNKITIQSGVTSANYTLTLPTAQAGGSGYALVNNGSGVLSWAAATSGSVTSVSGTLNRITSTSGTTPVIDISASYIGQSSITTLGTIVTGVWNGTAIANAYLANSAVTVNGTSISLGASGTVTAAAGTLTGTTLNSTIVTSSLTSVGTIGSGTWQGTVINPTYGGTGVNNGAFTITLAGNLVTTGAFNTTFAASATGTYTLPSTTSTLLANNLGISGGTTLIGGTGASEKLIFNSTSNATKGKFFFDTTHAYTLPVFSILDTGTTGGAQLFHFGTITSGYSGMWLLSAATTPSSSNYFLSKDAASLYLNAGSTSIQFEVAASAKMLLNATGLFIGGNTSATALLHLKAGTASANTAPFKFTSGTNLTTAEAGAMEYNGTNLFFTRTGTTRQTVLTANVVTTEALVSDTTITVNINGTNYKLLAVA